MKICLISFDFWHYDCYIVTKLKEMGVDANHINIGYCNHKSMADKLINTFNKVFLGRNLKHKKRQEFIINSLENLGFQDQILVLNPDTIDDETLQFIKSKTNQLITYLYDSLDRYPVQDKLHYFDRVFSFDDKDVKDFNLIKATNYNYLEYSPQTDQTKIKNDIFYITSFDKNRNKILRSLVKKFTSLQTRFQIFVIGKKTWLSRIKYFFYPRKKQIELVFRTKNIPHQKVVESYYTNTKTILDLTRNQQVGLSFRVFEAMALEKKIITNNTNIINYDFYNPKNILVLEPNFSNLTKEFIDSPYEKIPQDIYDKYTLENWVKTIFNL